MSLRSNSRAANVPAEKTHGKINLCRWMPEADADGDLYGENGERMPYYPARPRQQPPYELAWDGALGDFRTLVLEMRRMRPRRLGRKGVILGSADDAFAQNHRRCRSRSAYLRQHLC